MNTTTAQGSKQRIIDELKKDIPSKWRGGNRWVLYQLQAGSNGKLEKLPCTVNGLDASMLSISTWDSFDNCANAYIAGNFAGLAFAHYSNIFVADFHPAQDWAASATAPIGTTGSQPSSPFLSFADLMLLPPKQWLINQILGKGDIVMMFGEPGSGKTMTLIDMMFAACQGKKWANKFDVVRPLSVAYCAGEGVSGLKDRFASSLDHWGITTLPNFYFLPMAPQLFGKGRADHITEQVKAFKANHGSTLDILVIDTLHAATAGADENSAKDMGIVLDAVRAAVRELGCAVILCHHTAKDGERERGSSALHGAMDTMIKVKKNGANSIECFKLKDGEPWKPQQFTLIAKGPSVYVFWDGDAKSGQGSSKAHSLRDEIYQELLSNPFDEFSSSDLNKLLGESANSINKRLNELLRDRKVERRQEKTGHKTVLWKLDSAIAAVQSVTI